MKTLLLGTLLLSTALPIHAQTNGAAQPQDTPCSVISRGYDPYGNVLSEIGALAEANLYRFSSKEYHPASGLIYYLYRYCDPNLQRWINKDPIQEKGGYNLYRFAFNHPLKGVDFWGLSFTEGDTCEEARAEGLDEGDVGGVICKNGRKIPCVWKPGTTDISNPTAQDISIKCIWKHEQSHEPEGDCPDCDTGLSRLGLRPGASENKSECAAYTLHIDCLQQSLAQGACHGDDWCYYQISQEINALNNQRARYCGTLPNSFR